MGSGIVPSGSYPEAVQDVRSGDEPTSPMTLSIVSAAVASVARIECERNPGVVDAARIFPGFHFVASGLRV